MSHACTLNMDHVRWFARWGEFLWVWMFITCHSNSQDKHFSLAESHRRRVGRRWASHAESKMLKEVSSKWEPCKPWSLITSADPWTSLEHMQMDGYLLHTQLARDVICWLSKWPHIIFPQTLIMGYFIYLWTMTNYLANNYLGCYVIHIRNFSEYTSFSMKWIFPHWNEIIYSI